MQRLLLLLLCLLTLPLSAQAQYNPNRESSDRLDRLERDLMVLQRQLARGNGALAPAADSDLPPEVGAQSQARVGSMEEELRKLRGKIEENEFQLKRLNETVTKMQKDNDFRFGELEKGKTAPTAEPGLEAPAAPAADRQTPKGNPEAATSETKEFDSPRDHYNYAFRLLNQTRYDEAAASFKNFTEKYPKDALAGNAYYWLGETHYIRRDYVKAADTFRQGFEAMPSGPKAADNLLKLAMSLGAMKNTKDACTVLNRITTKFKDSASAVAQKAASESTRLGCK